MKSARGLEKRGWMIRLSLRDEGISAISSPSRGFGYAQTSVSAHGPTQTSHYVRFRAAARVVADVECASSELPH